jgi:hypothetical protein
MLTIHGANMRFRLTEQDYKETPVFLLPFVAAFRYLSGVTPPEDPQNADLGADGGRQHNSSGDNERKQSQPLEPLLGRDGKLVKNFAIHDIEPGENMATLRNREAAIKTAFPNVEFRTVQSNEGREIRVALGVNPDQLNNVMRAEEQRERFQRAAQQADSIREGFSGLDLKSPDSPISPAGATRVNVGRHR